MITQEWEIILLLVATFSGWVLGRTSGVRRGKSKSGSSTLDIQSLMQWFELQNEMDIQKLLESLEVSTDTIDTHLALASMYRRKGEFSKSLAIHQNIFGRPNVAHETSDQVQFELACDYLNLGMLGRAESLFHELIKNQSVQKYKSLDRLIQIYDLEKDWQGCVNSGEQFGRKITHNQQHALSHHYCELAKVALSEKLFLKAEQYLKKATSHSSENARAWLLLAQVEATRDRFNVAFKYTRKAAEKSPYFISEILPVALSYSLKTKNETQYEALLQKLNQKISLSSVQLALAEIAYKDNPDEMMTQLTKNAENSPSNKVITKILGWQKEQAKFSAEDYTMMNWLYGLLIQKTPYQCYQCGYEATKHSWQCPQCKEWDTVQDKEDRRQLMDYGKVQF